MAKSAEDAYSEILKFIKNQDIEANEKKVDREAKKLEAMLEKYNSVNGKLFNSFKVRRIELENAVADANDAIESYNKTVDKLKDTDFKTGIVNALKGTIDGTQESVKEFIEKAQEAITNELKDLVDESKLSKSVKNIEGLKLLSGDELDNELNKLGLEEDKLQEIKNLLQDSNDLRQSGINISKSYLNQLQEINGAEEKSVQIRKQGLSELKSGFNQILSGTKSLASMWGKVDQAASKFAKSVGLGASGLQRIRKDSINAVANGQFGRKYNIGADELAELEATYSNNIGRNVMISKSDQEDMAAMRAVMGENGIDFATKLENFGLSYTDAANKAGKMFKEAGKYGISFDKYSKNVANNIKLAQNYTFKNGIKGLESMAKKATAMKLDMQQVASFADKVSTVEGAINTGAQLQVLGGPFAQFSDPMGMMNEALTDMEGLQDRFEKMIGGLGNFDAQKGEIAISAFDKQRIKVAAEAMGMSYDQVMETAMAKGRQKFIGDQIANKGYTEDEQELLKNIATVSGGKAKISYVDRNGERREIDDLAKSRLTEEDLKEIREGTQSESDDIKDIAVLLRGWDDYMQGAKKQKESAVAKWFENWGIGEGIESITDNIATMTGLLQVIAASSLFTGLYSLVSGIATFISGGGIKGALGKVIGKGAGSATKAAGGAAGSATSAALKSASKVGNRGIAINTIGRNLSKNGHGKIGGALERYGEKVFEKGVGMESKALSGAGKAAKFGKFAKAGGGVAAGLIDGVATGSEEFGWFGQKGKDYGKDAKGRNKEWKKYGRTAGSAIGAAGGTLAGAGIASALVAAGLASSSTGVGAIIGIPLALAGAAIGKWAGGGFANQKRRAKKAEEFGLGGMLSGDYSVSELRKISKGKVVAGSKLEQKLKANNDLDTAKDIKQIREQQANIDKQVVSAKSVEITTNDNIATGKSNMANGGMLNGPSHAQGGMPILGSNIEVEGGEFVVNKRSAKKYQNTLNAINSMGNGGIIKPRKMETGGSIIINQTGGKLGGQSFGVDKITVDPINVNVSGSIKLEGANGQKAELTADLLKNPQFISEITKLITKQMNINIHGANVINRPDA